MHNSQSLAPFVAQWPCARSRMRGSSVIAAVFALAGLAPAAWALSDALAAEFELTALADDPHVLDPSGLCGGTVVDRFLANPNGEARGRKVVRLADGDYVVAALVPRHGFHPSPNGMWNLGLVRYRLPCSAVPWTAGPYRFPTSGIEPNRYMVYPNVDSPQFVSIIDLQAYGSQLYILADRAQTDVAGSDRDVVVVVVNLTGELVGVYPALNSALDERAAGMAFYSDGQIGSSVKLFVVGNTYGLPQVPTGSVATLVRMTRGGGGALTRDNNLGAGGNLTYVDYTLPNSYCAAAAQPCHLVADALTVSSTGGFFHRLYIGGSLRRNTTGNWDFLVLAAGFNGVLDGSFGDGGRQWAIFDRGGNNRDAATAIVARSTGLFQDEVFVIGEVAQQTNVNGNAGNRGIGVAKFTNAGLADMSFGSLGKVVHGGCASAPCQDFLNGGDVESYPRAAIGTGGRLIIVGRERTRPQCIAPLGCTSPHVSVAELSLVSMASGNLLDRSSPIPDADLFDVRIEASGRVTTAGVYVENSLPRALTAQFRSDRLFGNGFQQP